MTVGKGARRPTPLVLALALIAALLPVVVRPAAAHAATPSYAFHDVGTTDAVGFPVGLTTDGALGTSGGVYRDGTFTAMPTIAGADPTNSNIADISPDGIAIGVEAPGGPCQYCFDVVWDEGHGGSPHFLPQYPDLVEGSSSCGEAAMATIDSAEEIGGLSEYVSSSAHSVCTAGDTTLAGLLMSSPYTNDSHVSGFGTVSYGIVDVQPGWALGAESGDGATTLYNRTTSTFTKLASLDLPGGNRSHVMSADGSVVLGLNPSEVPEYRAASGTTAALPLAGNTNVLARSMNDSHQIVGESSQHVLYWASPTATPTDLDALPGIPSGDTLSGATEINDEGDIAGTFFTQDDTEHVYVLSVANALSAGISFSNPDGSTFNSATAAVGQSVKATVTLTNASLTDPITSVSVSPPLTAAPSGYLTPSGSPPTVPTTIAAGSNVTYSQSYTIAALGKVTLSLTATGSLAGQPQNADANTLVRLGQALSITTSFIGSDGLAVPSNTIKMTDTDDGEVPQDVTVKVVIKNVSASQQDNITFNGPLIPSFHTGLPSQGAVPVTVTSGPTPPDPIGNLAVGATAQRTYATHITDNGVFDFSSQLTSADDATSATNVSGGVGTLTANPTALLFLKLHPVTDISGLITPGQPVLLGGELDNRSQTQSIDLTPVVPSVPEAENAGDGILYDSSVSPDPDGTRPPLAGPIAPGAKVAVEAEIDTAPATGGSTATVTYAPTGFLMNVDGTETELSGEQVRVAKGTSPVEIHFDVRDPIYSSSAGQVAGAFANAAFIGTLQWFANFYAGGYEVLKHPVDSAVKLKNGTVAFVTTTAEASTQAARMLGALYVLRVYDATLTDEEKLAFTNQLVADFEASHVKAGIDLVQAAAQPILDNFANAVATGNYTRVADMAGTATSNVVTGTFETVLTELAFQKIALLAKAKNGATESEMAERISLADSIAQQKVKGKVGNALKNIFEGQNLLAGGAKALQDAYGLSKTQIERLVAYCGENGVTVALRSRSKRALALIEKGLAVGKNIAIKLKNVDDLDVLFLGYDRADLNTVVWAQPISESEFRANLAKFGRKQQLTPEIRELAQKRYQQRIKEWSNKSYHDKVNHWAADGKIDVYFDGAGSGVPELDATRASQRRFKLEQATDTKGRYYKRLLVGQTASPTAKLVRITQDVDLVAILGGNGQILPPKLRARVYEFLENTLGIQHPDTVPWVLNGEVSFEAKTGLLIDHLAGGEAMAVFDPTGGVRAAFFDPNLTVFDKVTKGGYIFLKGAFNNPYAPIAKGALGALLGAGG